MSNLTPTNRSAATPLRPATRSQSRVASLPNPKPESPASTPLREQSNDQNAKPKLSASLKQKRRRLNYADNITPEGFEEPSSAVPLPLGVDFDPPLHQVIPSNSASALSTHPHISLLKEIVLNRLAGARTVSLLGLHDEESKVRNLLQQTVHAGEGNSMMIIGARGTGKTTMVNQLIDELSKDNKDHFHVIRLNGFIHTDDKLALREIWRQLGREMEVDDQGPGRNYADTLTTLLAVLSHPAELSTDAHPDQAANSVIFILDEFDQFASYPRQTLLYNLFDIAQSRKAPIAVLGLTTRVDVVDTLEKRVKSRFSHRSVHLSLPRSLEDFTHICKSAMQLEPDTIPEQHRIIFTEQVAPKKREKGRKISTTTKTPLDLWNTVIDELFQNQQLLQHLSAIYHTTRSIPTALTSLMLPVSTLHCPTMSIAVTDFDLTLMHTCLPPDSKLSLLQTLPTLALVLLIAAARLDVILDAAPTNFNMAYEEYVTQTARSRAGASLTSGFVGSGAATLGGRVWSKHTARGMWERLVELELLVPATGRGLAADVLGLGAAVRGATVVADTDMVRCDVALEEIEGAVPEMDKVLESWCREI